MEICLAKKNNLIEVLYVIRECSRQLLEKGVKYWNNSLADYNDISHDIDKEYVYIIVIDHITVGTATIKPSKTDSNTTILSRLAIYPPYQKRGLAHSILKFAEDIAIKRGSKVLKGTTPVDDKTLGQLLEENGFINKGIENEVPEEFVKINFEKILKY